jgi:translocation and assembly module TamA
LTDRLLAAAILVCASSSAFAQSQPAPAGEDAIVSETEFEAALPRIDDDLNAPLAPITPLPPPPATVETPPDPALTTPLPPLATFDVTPAPATPGATEDTEVAEEVRYRVVIEGLQDVKLAGRFRDLSALEKGDGEAANGAVVTARAREDERLALTILQSEGYYDAVVTSTVAPAKTPQDRIVATITAVPGQRYKLGAIRVDSPPTIPPGLAREALKLESGAPIVAADVEAAEANVLLRLPQQGYPFVQLGQRDVLLDPATGIGDYTLPLDPGPRSAFGDVRTTGKLAFDARHVGVLRRFKPGDLYDSRKIDDLREAMVATGLFSSVAVEPIRTGTILPDGTEQVDLNVIQEAGPARTLAAQGGYATGQGLTIQGSWTHRNLFPPEGALILEGTAGTREQSAAVSFRRQNAGKRDRTVSLSLRGARQRYQAYDALTAQITGRISRESTPIWQKRWTWNYGFELLASDENRRDPSRRQDDGTYFIVALPGQLGYDRSNNLLDPTRGFRVTGRISPELSKRSSGGFDQYVRGLIDASAYYPVKDNLVIAGRARFGSIVGAPRDRIAPSRRLYSGGGGSVRGFGFQELGPRDINNDPIGGRALTEFALEARYRFGNYGIVPFIDAGQVYTGSVPKLSNLRFGAGIGGRLYTNFGPIRVDVATPIGRKRGESKIALYISIGQAF